MFYFFATERNIPIFLIVGGVFGLLETIVLLKMRSLRRIRETSGTEETTVETTELDFPHFLINWFLLCWFIAGCYWVYHIYEPNFDNPSSSHHCNYILFTFAFWLLNVFVIIVVASVLFCCSMFVCCSTCCYGVDEC